MQRRAAALRPFSNILHSNLEVVLAQYFFQYLARPQDYCAITEHDLHLHATSMQRLAYAFSSSGSVAPPACVKHAPAASFQIF
jgi:hypothetical protein